jgi:ABC-type multidrug transport system ATPase subunit
MDAFFGRSIGSVTLNGISLTEEIFEQHCYVVVQHDEHWPYLSCRETLRYAAELYDVAAPADIDSVVNEIIAKMGLKICRDTRNARLSGGQRRRLSLGIALLKQPTLLFLDEPTSGLDAAAAENIMHEIVNVAKNERLIILCTIHQPSTKVYNGFDQVMILSKGREAYSGPAGEAILYFDSIGYPLPVQTNPAGASRRSSLGQDFVCLFVKNDSNFADRSFMFVWLLCNLADHILDLVNADFSDDAAVDKILDSWEEKRPEAGHSLHHKKGFGDVDEDEQIGVKMLKRAPLCREILTLIRRHSLSITRDPILYIGRCLLFLIMNIIFALIFIRAREWNQSQATNKIWINIAWVGAPSNLGAIAVYVLKIEFNALKRETKNGMVRPLSYFLAKSFLVLPFIFIFAAFALVIPAFAVMDFPFEALGTQLLLWAACMFVFECFAECLSVWVNDPILGMMLVCLNRIILVYSLGINSLILSDFAQTLCTFLFCSMLTSGLRASYLVDFLFP